MPPPALLQAFDVSNPNHVTDTPIATIWRVTRHDGSFAALKVYRDADMRDEAPGFALQAAWQGRGAAYLYAQTDGAVLLEWLDGPTLGDMTRSGQDEEATKLLGDVAAQLHKKPPDTHHGFPSLTNEFNALFTSTFTDDCPAHVKAAIIGAQTVARPLIETQSDIRPLHRDLHHDNVKGSARGYLAFDAKGIIGERTYELANAFRNPVGAENLYCDPRVIQRRLGVWSRRFDVNPDRLLAWAHANAALSLAWTAKGKFDATITQKDPAGITFLQKTAVLLKS